MNQLMQPQMQQDMPQGQPMQPQASQQPPNPQQVQGIHEHLGAMQQGLDKLIKLPDSELNLRALFDGAANAVLEYQTSGGKKGVSPQAVAAEMSDPNFPTSSSSALQIRQFLQNYFDKSVMAQAATTARFGAPQQPQTQPETQEGQPQ